MSKGKATTKECAATLHLKETDVISVFQKLVLGILENILTLTAVTSVYFIKYILFSPLKDGFIKGKPRRCYQVINNQTIPSSKFTTPNNEGLQVLTEQ